MIDIVLSAKIVMEEYLNSEAEVKDIDWRMVALYLEMTVDRDELIRERLYHLTARRKKGVRVRKPIVTNPKISVPMRREERK